ncbi:unnamed protein product [Cuscuta campestris]|uniref:Uncharacterized protein n=1 Tax=Cuscuta campestris TaxID=132261 RepID=A0A484NHL2_9ASTE|nr:unnamed protein product [Cuscuta campestris]
MVALQWLSLVAAIWLQSVNGTNLNFPAYSSRLKQLLSLSQVQLNDLAFANDAGKLFGWFSGVAAAYLPLWLVLLIGSSLGFVGYGVQYLFLINRISSLSFQQVFLLTAVAGNSICWINTVCYIVAIRNFPLDSQVAVGISTSYVGLSAKIFTDVVEAAIGGSASPNDRAGAYLLLNSVLPLVVSVVASPFTRDAEIGKSRSLAGGFGLMFVITIATGIYAVITSVGSTSSSISRSLNLAGMAVWMAIPLLVPVTEQIKEAWQGKCLLRRDVGVCKKNNSPAAGEEGGAAAKEEEGIGERKEMGAMGMVKKADFWIYYMVYLFGATLGLVYMNNLGQIAESRGCAATASLVSLSSSFSFFGRLLPSLCDSIIFSRSRSSGNPPAGREESKISRAASIGAAMAPMCGAFFLLLHGSHICLYVSTAVIGTCTGAITSLAVSATAELFGARNFGVNHNIVVTNIPIGSFLFGNAAALVYKRQGRRHAHGGGGGGCMGTQCFHATFLLWGGLCSLGTWLALLLHARTRRHFASPPEIQQIN